ncbi:hypothetical protein BASA81_011156 [Batrachochytrium salamandrivorans]|nr:hypothetical protein BASA81_011156 [Batrachochytrium salamandrivorans]
MPWHSDPNQDLDFRRQLISLTVNFLNKRTPSVAGVSDADHQKHVVDSARKLEVALYKASKTKQEYMDTATLKQRILELERSASFVNAQQKLSAVAPPQSSASSSASSTQAASTAPSQSTTPAPPSSSAVPPPQAAATTASAAPPTAPSTTTAAPTADDIQKQRRNRLVLLRHASRCVQEKCQTQYCPAMKVLWAHVSLCQKNDCSVPHCVSSHYVLSHFHRCRDSECQVCVGIEKKSLDSPQQHHHHHQALATQPPPPPPHHHHHHNAKTEHVDVQTYNKRLADSAANTNSTLDPKFTRGSKDGSGPSLPLSMPKEEIVQHLDALSVEFLQLVFAPMLRKLMEHTKFNNGVFNEPVDPIALNIPDYFNVVKRPMDLGTIRRRLDNCRYHRPADFEADVRLVFDNAMRFNPAENFVHYHAQQLKNLAEQEFKKCRTKLAEPSAARKGGLCELCKLETCEKCVLCERGCISLEPKLLYCAGTCGMRIAKSAHFYSLPGSLLHWCNDCHEKRKTEAKVIDVSTGNVYNKSDLIKRKNDELFGETWVNCDSCKQWCHQACALFNQRKQNPQNKDDPYKCPKCLVEESATPQFTVPGARELEPTMLSCFLENWVCNKLKVAFESNPKKQDVGDAVPKVIIRVLSNCDETFITKPFAKATAGGGVAPDYTYRSRAIFLFQHLDGVDVLLFIMYVQEFGPDAPPPNTGKVYIAYLDSVHYFRPRQYRTLVYHDLLLAYLEYVRRLGLNSCYIWACPPPTKKDDYILHCHPEDQRVPSNERLRMWYHEMIKRGVVEGMVLSSCTLFEEHFEQSLKKSGATGKRKSKAGGGTAAVSKSSGGGKPGGKGGGQQKGKAKGGTRLLLEDGAAAAAVAGSERAGSPAVGGEYFTAPAGEEDLLEDFNFDTTTSNTPVESTAAMRGTASRTAGAGNASREEPLYLGLHKSDLDALDPQDLASRRQNKLAASFRMPMFDGDYWPNEFEEVALDRAKKAREARFALEDNKKRAKPQDLTAQGLIDSGEASKLDLKQLVERVGESLENLKPDFLVVKLAHECSYCGEYLLQERYECRHPDCLQSGFAQPNPFALCVQCFLREQMRSGEHQHGGIAQISPPMPPPTTTKVKIEPVDEGGAAQKEELSIVDKKRVWDQQVLQCTRQIPSELAAGCDNPHQLVFVNENLPVRPQVPDKLFKNHLLDTRHAFLSLCTGNRYEFNQLRRVKHSTSMILYHLHNPDAPAHLFTCMNCADDIIDGFRFNCPMCQGGDYDLCLRCVQEIGHMHRLNKIEVTSTVDHEASESKRKKGLEKRRQRKRSLQVFLNALVHASSCEDQDCSEASCTKMKDLLKHRQQCTTRVRGGCEICRRVLCLVQMHARGSDETPACSLDNCPVPHCLDLKKHLKQKDESQAAAAAAAAAGHPTAETDGRPPVANSSAPPTGGGGGGVTRKKDELKKRKPVGEATAPPPQKKTKDEPSKAKPLATAAAATTGAAAGGATAKPAKRKEQEVKKTPSSLAPSSVAAAGGGGTPAPPPPPPPQINIAMHEAPPTTKVEPK